MAGLILAALDGKPPFAPAVSADVEWAAFRFEPDYLDDPANPCSGLERQGGGAV